MKKAYVGAALALLCFLVLPPASNCSTLRYTLTGLGTLGGNVSSAFDVNSAGKVVGESEASSGGEHAFLFDGSMHDLGVLSGCRNSYGCAINDSGKVVGYCATTSGLAHAFLYDGTMHDLGTLGGNTCWASDINNTGRIVGESATYSGSYHAYMYDGVMHDLGTPAGYYNSWAEAINASGKIVGFAQDSGHRHAFLYDGTWHDLGTLAGRTDSEARAINGNGVIVGDSGASGLPTYHAFLYNGSMHDLGTLAGYTNSSANAIDDYGRVVGCCSTEWAAQRAFIYDGTTMLDLNSLVVNAPGWTLLNAMSISASGQITGWGIDPTGHNNPFLLTPYVPEPSSLMGLLCGIGAAGMALKRRRR